MTWNWEQSDWPEFRWDSGALQALEAQFQLQSGVLIGSIKHIPDEDRTLLIIDMITSEAIKTSEIENEFLLSFVITSPGTSHVPAASSQE